MLWSRRGHVADHRLPAGAVQLSGCHRVGTRIRLSPSTGLVVSELILKGESSINIDGLSFSRFADIPKDWKDERGWMPLPEGSSYRDYPYSHYVGVGGLPREILKGSAGSSSREEPREPGEKYVC